MAIGIAAMRNLAAANTTPQEKQTMGIGAQHTGAPKVAYSRNPYRYALPIGLQPLTLTQMLSICG
jgi:D-alanyl-D-alanine carboxypeptidase